jgi:phosphoribosylformylglycinamidine cyclo-ligase
MKDDKYARAGVDYALLDPSKLVAQRLAASTAGDLPRLGLQEVAASRGESAYVMQLGEIALAFVTEALGTKNLVADAVRAYTGKTHYDQIARDTVATILNDLCSVGARPASIASYWGAGDGEWFADAERARDLSEGWAAACRECRVAWGGGETQVLPGLIEPGKIVLGGAAVGIIAPSSALLSGERLEVGDQILIAPASGIHANGLSLARKLAGELLEGYPTRVLSDPQQRTYGELLLEPTPQYAPLVEALLTASVPLHYAAHITGHGWRKLMRASRELGYIIDVPPPVPPVLSFIQERAGMSLEEAYGTFNMGAGFALYCPEDAVAPALAAASSAGFQLLHSGRVVAGPRRVEVPPLGLHYAGSTLQVRAT